MTPFAASLVPSSIPFFFTLFKFVNFEHFTPIFTSENPFRSLLSGFSMFIFNILEFRKKHATLYVLK